MLFELGLGLTDPGLQRSIVSQENHALAIEVEPTRRIDIRYIDEVSKRRSALIITELAKRSKWLIEKNQRHNGHGG